MAKQTKTPGYYHVTWQTGLRDTYHHSCLVKLNRKKRGQEQTWEYAGVNEKHLFSDFPVGMHMQWTPLSGEYVFTCIQDSRDCRMNVRVDDDIVRILYTGRTESMTLDDLFATQGTWDWRIVQS